MNWGTAADIVQFGFILYLVVEKFLSLRNQKIRGDLDAFSLKRLQMEAAEAQLARERHFAQVKKALIARLARTAVDLAAAAQQTSLDRTFLEYPDIARDWGAEWIAFKESYGHMLSAVDIASYDEIAKTIRSREGIRVAECASLENLVTQWMAAINDLSLPPSKSA